jgi:hypothetical protein
VIVVKYLIDTACNTKGPHLFIAVKVEFTSPAPIGTARCLETLRGREAKRFASRPKDIEDIRLLETLAGEEGL